MTNIFLSNYLSRRPIEIAMKRFGAQFHAGHKVIDIGCGKKPYANLFDCEYIGVDPFPETASDLKADAWSIPLPDGCADGIVLNQSMEHIPKTVETVSEIYRLLRPGGQVFVSVPQTMRVHGTPVPLSEVPIEGITPSIATVWKDDYYRFTKYGLLYLFREFKPVMLRETRTTFSTLIQHLNYFVAGLGLGWLPAPFYLVNNLSAVAGDWLLTLFIRLPFPILKKFDELVLRGLTIDYVFIARKKVERETGRH